MKVVGPLEIGEIKAISFDFSSEAAEGLTLSSPSVTVALLDGTDASPGTVLLDSPSILDQMVVQKVRPGVAGCTYVLHAYATDSSGLRHHISCKMKVVPA